MAHHPRWAVALLAAAALLSGCGGSDKQESSGDVARSAATFAATAGAAAAATGAAAPGTAAAASAAGTATVAPQASGSAAAGKVEYTRLEKYIPTDDELPDRVAYQKTFDLSNEAAANDPAQLKQFQDAGRLTGIQVALSVEAGARTISIGISYYNNTTEPKKLLRGSGDPAATTAAGRFPSPAIGDEYIAQRLQLGSGEAAAQVINIAWVRGPFFISLADLGGTQDTPTDLAVKLAQLIDGKLKADPTP